ncbi:extensin family protein [Roseovarius aestuarii]|nr:extensin family protein [Roseovarius aestuarii]
MRFGVVCASVVFGLTVLGGWAVAQAPGSSLRPVARPGSIAVPAQQQPVQDVVNVVTPANTPPPQRPTAGQSEAQPVETARPAGRDQFDDRAGRATTQRPRDRDARQGDKQASGEGGGIFKSLRPLLRPRGVRREAVARQKELARGAVCGDLAIQGVDVGAVPGRLGGCGVESAVKVRNISGVDLTMRSVMDCTTAKALKGWIDGGMKPAVGNRGGGVSSIRVVAHYACRTRNSQKGAKISEHGKGRAIDIAGFTLKDGSDITVLTDWGKGRKGQILRRMHQSACGPFGTVLGPEANKFHRDHFHFDTARYRSGSYCR